MLYFEQISNAFVLKTRAQFFIRKPESEKALDKLLQEVIVELATLQTV